MGCSCWKSDLLLLLSVVKCLSYLSLLECLAFDVIDDHLGDVLKWELLVLLSLLLGLLCL
mgnify:CR=1 FL=1